MSHLRNVLVALIAVFVLLLCVIIGERLYQRFGADITSSHIVEVIGGE